MTQHKLVIAEKPSVAQSIAAVLGATKRNDGYIRIAQSGHQASEKRETPAGIQRCCSAPYAA